MKPHKLRLMLTTTALLIVFAASLLPLSVPLSNLLMGAFFLLALFLMLQQIRWETRLLPPEIPAPATPSPVENPVVMIVGPYAKKWFTQSNYTNSTRYNHQATWLLVASPQELHRRLTHIREHAPETPLAAFFPFLPDGHESVALLNAKLQAWQNEFVGLPASLQIPCVVGMYARLSNERRAHDINNASWNGSLDMASSPDATIEAAQQALQQQLWQQASNNSAVQRAALGSTLLHWCSQQGISAQLQQLFNHSPFQFNRLLLCDYGYGFTRHGAWALWMEEQYGVLPALGPSATMPPLPALRFPEAVKKAQSGPVPVQRRARLPAVLWSLALVTLLIAGQMVAAGIEFAVQRDDFRQRVEPFADRSDLSVQRLQQSIQQLQQWQLPLQQCASESRWQHWGFSLCPGAASYLQQQISWLSEVATLTTLGTVPLFEAGSAQLSPAALPLLQALVERINQVPNQHILIVGHTDSTGSDALNARLSEERADAVRLWLIGQSIPASHIRIRGVGSTEPVASNSTATARQSNRRVEILILPPATLESESTLL